MLETSRKRQPIQSTAEWAAIRDRFLATDDAADAQRSISEVVDAIVLEAFQTTVAAAFPNVSLLAIGAWGRRELFPYSEIDVALIYEGEPPAGLKDAHAHLAALLRESGLRPNSRLCTIGEGTLDFQINLLDARVLAGDAKLPGGVNGKLAERLSELTRARHEKYSNTPYWARPDVKEAPGGIRDIHLLARLAKLGVDVPPPDEEFRRAAAYLAAIRFRLHYDSGADRNVFENPPAEYFRHARVIYAAVKREPPPAESDLKTVLSRPDAAKVLRSLRDAGLLERMVPQWADIDGAIDPHADHTFTEGEQALITIERLEELQDSTDPGRRRFRDLLSAVGDPAGLKYKLLLREQPQITILRYARIAASHPQSTIPWRLDQLWKTSESERTTEVPDELAPGVSVRIEPLHGAYQLTVVAPDVPFLFASLAGAISSFGLDILKAEAFNSSKGNVLDTFVFADPKHTLEKNPPELDRLQDLIRRVGLGKTDARRLLRNRAQPDPAKRSFAPQIRFDSEAHDSATLVEVIAEDHPGLLYSVAMVFSTAGCNIDTVLIDTKGNRAIDVFYVSQGGTKLTADVQQSLRKQLEAAC